MAFGDSVSRPSPESVTDASIKIDHRHEYHVRHLPTRSVILFPTSARVPGSNQITIIGLTPTLDEHSVKVEGTGHAMITDIAIDLLPNRESFDDVFTELNDPDNKFDDPDTNSSEEDDKGPELKAALDKMRQLLVEEKTARENVYSAENRLQILDAYGRSIAAGREGHSKTSFEDGLKIYKNEREDIFRDHLEGEAKVQVVAKEIALLQKATTRLRKHDEKDRVRARAAKDKEREKQRRKDQEEAKEGKRVRKEREMYWPKQVHIITVNIYVKATSDDSEGLSLDDVDMSTCDLTLSYVTTHAFWSPTYDMALSTATNWGVLCFDARLTNQTSETWDGCQIMLSTSQTDFSGLGESAPTLVPWRIGLAWKDQTRVTPAIMYSGEEMNVHPAREPTTRTQRQELFGVERPLPQVGQELQTQLRRSPFRESPYPNSQIVLNPQNQPAFGTNAAVGGGIFASIPAPSSTASLFGHTQQVAAKNNVSIFDTSVQQRKLVQGPGIESGGSTVNTMRGGQVINRSAFNDDDYDDTPASLQVDLKFKEPSSEETGLATTYILQGLKSLSPSSTTSRHRVARITYSDIVFSRVVVAKHKQVVFLTAKVLNDSGLALPKGRTGLTVDGSFLGRAALPHCIAGDTFTLGLGIDPSIQVIYPRPEVKQSVGSMMFSTKENHTFFARTITLVNTRDETQGGPVQVTVLDQMPVTEDERVKITLVKPVDLVVNGPSVSTGESGDDGDDDKKEWGRAGQKPS
ncbi:hypothetical protein E0Z10_g5149 [Xylaria hypoxylon]|uniref:DUF4140 domain-containing protein n=1 Tax=Xylaria hypoxylon TaxID=37992 RepID=A0A4Z0YYQ9_9PEZI|nr:hypothetical protein E0Z10_g5149 [Xylaria hypoxylon]